MSVFIIPLAGLSSRFLNAGYQRPKYQLLINNISMFNWSVSSFEKYFNTDIFIFVCRNVYETPKFVLDEITKLNISNYEIIVLDQETLGQADTVYQGITKSKYFVQKHNLNFNNEDVYIFNIDSKIINFTKPDIVNSCDGYLEVFKGNGDHWSFIDPMPNNTVKRTTEKEKISDLCSDGLYYFKKISYFLELFHEAIEMKKFTKNELYIAPMYNDLIKQNKTVKYKQIPSEEIIICGTPDEYEAIRKQNK